MSFQLKPSSVEKGIFEVLEKGSVVKELPISFLNPKVAIPPHFSSLEELEKWLAECEVKLARKKIYQLLNARSYPSVILRRKLRDLGYSASICERVLSEVKELGYVQDEQFLESSIESDFRRGYGPRYIEQKLKSKGLSSNLVRQFITPERQREKISECRRKIKHTERSKIIRSLQQKGFDFEIILETIENFS